ncbi:hypothetical protein COOONC_17872 [Cooperia oncophora]
MTFRSTGQKERSSPARMWPIYRWPRINLVYIETNGFVKSSPAFLLSSPVLAVFPCSPDNNMSPEANDKFIALFDNLMSANFVDDDDHRYIMVSVANLTYYYSFKSQIRLWSTKLTAAAGLYLMIMFYYCFADLLMSIPSLVLLLTFLLATSCVTAVAAGSVCQYGHASYIRLIGTLAQIASSSMFVINMFGERTERVQVWSRILFYGAQALLFLANERTF